MSSEFMQGFVLGLKTVAAVIRDLEKEHREITPGGIAYAIERRVVEITAGRG